jgi:hypothetical protein
MSSTAPRKGRTPEQVIGTKRSAFNSIRRTHTRDASGFLMKNLWAWVIHYLQVVTLPRKKFKTYKAAASERPGRFRLPSRAVIAVASDWGTGTPQAYRVSDLMRACNPDVTIHLGDVYYSGTSPEFRDYFLPLDAWPRGPLGTYVLNANHEMYSGGEGYFGAALPELKQETSYFCLETDDWRILGLDTGYYARTFPLLEFLLKGQVRLHDAIQQWLREVVFKDPSDDRPVVLLSHHEWFSAYDTEYGAVGDNLEPYLDRVYLWLWGHEHRFAGYGPWGPGKTPVRARCIGHGGMPIELGAQPKRDRNLVFSDTRQAGTVGGQPIGFCGFTVITLDGKKMLVTYRDELGKTLLEEAWVRGTKAPQVVGSGLLTLQPGKTFMDL